MALDYLHYYEKLQQLKNEEDRMIIPLTKSKLSVI
jgi:hypothetical protein